MTYQEGNLIISKFMGLEGNDAKYGNNYDKDWGKMIPVLDKIREEFSELGIYLFDGKHQQSVWVIEDAIWANSCSKVFAYACELIIVINENRALSSDPEPEPELPPLPKMTEKQQELWNWVKKVDEPGTYENAKGYFYAECESQGLKPFHVRTVFSLIDKGVIQLVPDTGCTMGYDPNGFYALRPTKNFKF